MTEPRLSGCRISIVAMQYDEIAQLQDQHAAWALLRSPHAPLILSFLGRVFIESNSGPVPAPELISALDDELYALNERLGDGAFPRPAAAYLDEWASQERPWLRKTLPQGSDEPHYDLMPAVEKAYGWVLDLRARDFIGTESRLNTLFELLRQMVYGAETDPARRLDELRRRRAELDAEIARAERGELALLDDVGQRDRLQLFTRNARELLADLREVEENFRRLDRQLREQIAGWSGSKGQLLDAALSSRTAISESDQGRSFQALYDFLLSQQRQSELTDLLDRLTRIVETDHDRLRHVHFDWIDAGERTQATVRMLSEQLRRFLDDQVWLENRRVFDLLHDIEGHALAVRDQPPTGTVMEIDDTAPTVVLPFERPLYTPKTPVTLDDQPADTSDEDDDLDASALLDQIYVDIDALSGRVRDQLVSRNQVGLTDLVDQEPLRHGLAELIGFLSLSDQEYQTVIDEDQRDRIGWHTGDRDRVADVPRVSYVRRRGPS